MHNLKTLQKAGKLLLEGIGEDVNREGLQETPQRVANAWKQWAGGYGRDPKEVMKVFNNPGIDQMVMATNIDFYSMCEHHLAPFYGQVHVGYLPDKKVLGISKFARLTEIFARRLQIQERLTQQIADSVMKYVEPYGVGVVIEANHLCMRSRGVQKQNSLMTTNVLLGAFQEDKVRDEFIKSIKR